MGLIPRLAFELFHIIARHDWTGLRRSTSVISKGNVLGFYCNLGSLRYGNEYCVPGRAMNCTPRLRPSKKSEMLWLEQLII